MFIFSFLAKAGYGSIKEVSEFDTVTVLDLIEIEEIQADISWLKAEQSRNGYG